MLKATLLIALFLSAGSPDIDVAEGNLGDNRWLYMAGFLSQYDQSPTDGTMWYRQTQSRELPKDISKYSSFIAVADCSMIGDEALLRIRYDDYDSGWLPSIVFDCSGHLSTSTWMEEDGIIAEVDYYTAKEHGFLDRGGVEGEIIWSDLSQESEATQPVLDNSSKTLTPLECRLLSWPMIPRPACQIS